MMEASLESIVRLLKANGLPHSDLGQSNVEFITSELNGALAGCIGLEQYGQEGLLRSFVVHQDHQGKGMGHKLLIRLINRSRLLGVVRLHLLTTSAEHYFLKHNFATADRKIAPKAISQTTEFNSLCPASASYMTRAL
ncbi:MAG: arsenic resistance N-acetyltransferase ArsN2 [Bacteroidota bacterium]